MVTLVHPNSRFTCTEWVEECARRSTRGLHRKIVACPTPLNHLRFPFHSGTRHKKFIENGERREVAVLQVARTIPLLFHSGVDSVVVLVKATHLTILHAECTSAGLILHKISSPCSLYLPPKCQLQPSTGQPDTKNRHIWPTSLSSVCILSSSNERARASDLPSPSLPLLPLHASIFVNTQHRPHFPRPHFTTPTHAHPPTLLSPAIKLYQHHCCTGFTGLAPYHY